MKPENLSFALLGATQSKAKMFEYRVPENFHLRLSQDPSLLLTLTIGAVGDIAAAINEDRPDAELRELRDSLRFAARYFDSYVNSRLTSALDNYLLLLGAAAYYLCDLPGSAAVLTSRVPETLDVGASGVEDMLGWLLRGRFGQTFRLKSTHYDRFLTPVGVNIRRFASTGERPASVLEAVSALRAYAYQHGTPSELLLSDVTSAIARRRVKHSTWTCMPEYSGLGIDQWRAALSKRTFIGELWPAQRLLGTKGVFAGESAIVQMPTSAGKSRGTELAIRSAFISDRATLAVVVAPFRALCHEISDGLARSFRGDNVTVDEFTDATQADFDIAALLERKSVVVVTPEKLLYVLRHAPELAKTIGLVVYDEGHQFDSGTRGVTYELLLTTLKSMLPEGAQTVLISAVISNAEIIGSWLLGPDPNIVSGSDLYPTERTIAFTSWVDALGRLEFVDGQNPNTRTFFVPRMLQTYPLQLRKREKKARFFPDRDHGPSIALSLGLRLVHGGSVAIFCGTKATATGLCDRLLDAYDRGLQLDSPAVTLNSDHAATAEARRIGRLLAANLGPTAVATRAAVHGVFTHHGNTPHGIRLAVEHALKNGLIRFVICTSTLAQGVNLPIRYLVVTSVYQGRDRIKVRDFHNLIGRAGRSGMHTEGSVVFGDPDLFDQRRNPEENWRWDMVTALLQSRNSEPCASTLLSVLFPLDSDDGRLHLQVDPLVLARAHASNSFEFVAGIAGRLIQAGFSMPQLEFQLRIKQDILFAIESFLMTYAEQDAIDDPAAIRRLAEGTLAYHLADAEQRGQLVKLFSILAENISTKVRDPAKRALFGRTLFGVDEALAIEAWVSANMIGLLLADSDDELFETLWPAIDRFTTNSLFHKLRPQAVVQELAVHWLAGDSFATMHATLSSRGARIGSGKRARVPTEEHAVDLGENAFGYDASLALAAVTEIAIASNDENLELAQNLQRFQKLFKYGLPSFTAVLLYEVGFADRGIAQDLASLIGERTTREEVIEGLRERREAVGAFLNDIPSVFYELFERVAPEEARQQ